MVKDNLSSRINYDQGQFKKRNYIVNAIFYYFFL